MFKVLGKKIHDFLFGTKDKEKIETPTPIFSASTNLYNIFQTKETQQTEELEFPQDDPEFIKKCRADDENWGIINQVNTEKFERKLNFNDPLLIKVVNIEENQDSKIFISPKQLCQHFNLKPKQFYAWEKSENKLYNKKYKLEIISFPIDKEKYSIEKINYTKISDEEGKLDIHIIPKKGVQFIQTDFKVTPSGTFFDSGTRLAIRIKNLRKRKFISVAEKCPELIKEWDELNNGVSIDKVPHALKEKAFWICQHCGARYERRIDDRTRNPKPGCTKCIRRKNNNKNYEI